MSPAVALIIHHIEMLIINILTCQSKKSIPNLYFLGYTTTSPPWVLKNVFFIRDQNSEGICVSG